MASLLDKFFFPKWLRVLALWLNYFPNYEEVTHWYTGWKSMVSDNLLAEPLIKGHFKRALEMMSRAVTVQEDQQPGSVEQVSYLMRRERDQPQMARINQISQSRVDRLAETVRTTSKIPHSFKDLRYKRNAKKEAFCLFFLQIDITKQNKFIKLVMFELISTVIFYSFATMGQLGHQQISKLY